MYYLIPIGIIVFVVLGFLILSRLEKKHLNQMKDEYLHLLSNYGSLEHKEGTILFHMQNKTIEILFFVLKMNEELVINSRVMWEVFRAQKAMLYDQTEFLKSDIDKWIIVYPSILKIKRFINENEMVFVKHKDPIYDYQLILAIDLEDYLEDLKHGI